MDTTTSTRTVVGVFDDDSTAHQAVEQLAAAGFSRDRIEVSSGHSYGDDAARGNTGLTGNSPSDRSGGGIGGFLSRLFGSDEDNEKDAYAEAVRRGGTVVCVTTEEARQDRAVEILDGLGAVDIDQQVAAWKQSGYTSENASRSNAGDRSIPVVEEQLRVGKRAVQRGGVRVYSRVVEAPVEQQINLREEHVRVDRRSVDRPASEADLRRGDQVIEVTETAEEPVIEKRARVVEEVVVEKETRNRTETIRDTVRRSDVNVEQLADESGIYDDDFRADFRKRFGAGESASYETYAPAYQYGYRSASDERYRGSSWDEVEPALRSDYERSYPGSKWDQMKDAVRYGWQKFTGRR